MHVDGQSQRDAVDLIEYSLIGFLQVAVEVKSGEGVFEGFGVFVGEDGLAISFGGGFFERVDLGVVMTGIGGLGEGGGEKKGAAGYEKAGPEECGRFC